MTGMMRDPGLDVLACVVVTKKDHYYLIKDEEGFTYSGFELRNHSQELASDLQPLKDQFKPQNATAEDAFHLHKAPVSGLVRNEIALLSKMFADDALLGRIPGRTFRDF